MRDFSVWKPPRAFAFGDDTNSKRCARSKRSVSTFPAPFFARGGDVATRKRRIVIFGLTVSSSWGNGHATVWRGLLRSLASMGHDVVFFERNVPWYAGARDLHEGDGYQLVLYDDWSDADAR